MRAAAFLVLAPLLVAGCTGLLGEEPRDPGTRVILPFEGEAARVDPASSPVNANGTLLLARRGDAWLLLDAATGERRASALPATAREARWSPLDANSAYFLEENALFRYDVRRAESTRIGHYENVTRVTTGNAGDVVLLPDGHIALALVGETAGRQELFLLSIRERATFGRETVSSRSWPLDPPARAAFVTPSGLVVALGDSGTRVFDSKGALLRSVEETPLDACVTRAGDAWLVESGGRLFASSVRGGDAREIDAGAPLAASCRSVHAEGLALVTRAGRVEVLALDAPPARWTVIEGEASDAAPARDLSAVYFTRGGALLRAELPEDARAGVAARVSGAS